jgi:hypothetical protein
MGMSEWVLRRALPPQGETFQELVAAVARTDRPGFPLAELNEFLTQLTADELSSAVAERPRVELAPYFENYVAAMVELAAARKRTEPPRWTEDVRPLETAVFGSALLSLRLHLLTRSPPPFRRRNIFIDASLGDRI